MSERLKELPTSEKGVFPIFLDMDGSPGGLFVAGDGGVDCLIKSGENWTPGSWDKALNESSELSASAWATKFAITDQDLDNLLQTLAL